MSHKMKENAVKYEVGVCIRTGRIVWIHGPCRAAEHDINVARQAFVSFLGDGEMAVADTGYRGEFRTIKTPDSGHFRSGREYGEAAVASKLVGKELDQTNRSPPPRIDHIQNQSL